MIQQTGEDRTPDAVKAHRAKLAKLAKLKSTPKPETESHADESPRVAITAETSSEVPAVLSAPVSNRTQVRPQLSWDEMLLKRIQELPKTEIFFSARGLRLKIKAKMFSAKGSFIQIGVQAGDIAIELEGDYESLYVIEYGDESHECRFVGELNDILASQTADFSLLLFLKTKL